MVSQRLLCGMDAIHEKFSQVLLEEQPAGSAIRGHLKPSCNEFCYTGDYEVGLAWIVKILHV